VKAVDPIEQAIADAAPGPEETPPPARLLVVSVNDETGQFQVHNQGVTDIEAPTLLRLAAKTIEDKLGI
jgi:hypothetical protein